MQSSYFFFDYNAFLARDKDDIFMRRERKKEEASGIGSFCTSDEECRIEESFCLKKDLDDKGICACKIGYQFFRSSKQCIPGNISKLYYLYYYVVLPAFT